MEGLSDWVVSATTAAWITLSHLAHELNQDNGHGPQKEYPGENAWNHRLLYDRLIVLYWEENWLPRENNRT